LFTVNPTLDYFASCAALCYDKIAPLLHLNQRYNDWLRRRYQHNRAGQLVRICQMIPNKLLYSLDNLFCELRWALRYPYGEIIQFLGISLQPFAVAKKECKQGSDRNSFVAILKRMVLNHKVKENSGLGDQCWVQGLA
jgi:hypothetical protein